VLLDDEFQNAPLYKSVMVTRHATANAAALRGTRVAFNDEASLSGFHVMLDWLAREVPPIHLARHCGGTDSSASFFSQWVRTGGHASSLAAVQEGKADCAAIDILVWTRLRASRSELLKGLHILPDVSLTTSTSQPFVAGLHVPPATRTLLSDALASLHLRTAITATASLQDRVGLSHVRRFAHVTDRDYDSTRAVLSGSGSLARSEHVMERIVDVGDLAASPSSETSDTTEQRTTERPARFC